MFVITAAKCLAVRADVIHPQARLTSCCTLQIFFFCVLEAGGPEEVRLKSFVCFVKLREPGNESTVHLQDELGD